MSGLGHGEPERAHRVGQLGDRVREDRAREVPCAVQGSRALGPEVATVRKRGEDDAALDETELRAIEPRRQLGR